MNSETNTTRVSRNRKRSNKSGAVGRRLVLAMLGLISLASWGVAVLLMREDRERVLGLCAGLVVTIALFRSVGSERHSSSERIPLFLFIMILPALSGFYLCGILGGSLSSLAVFGLSVLWLTSKRFHRGLGIAAIVLEISAVIFIPADVILRRGAANIQVEPNPTCPLVRRLPRMKCWENESPGELTAIFGPNAFVEVAPNRQTTDRKGFSVVRGSSESRPYDIILLGDSYTANSAVGNWPELICRDTGYNIRNLGISATGPWDEYMNLRLEHPDLRLNPGAKILWCLFSGNDLDDFYGPLPFEKAPFTGLFTRIRITSENFRRNAWLPFALQDSGTQNFMRSLFAARTRIDVQSHPNADKVLLIDRQDGPRMLFLRHYIDQARKTQREIEAMPAFPALEATIWCMANFVRSQSLDLTVLIFPSKEEVYRWLAESGETGEPWSTPAAPTGFGKAVRGLCEKHGLSCHDLTPAFVTNSKPLFLLHGKAMWQRDDTHWNREGNELTARIVTDILRSPKR